MAAITGATLRQELEQWGIIALLGTSTAAGGGADRIRDDVRLKSVAVPSSRYNESQVRFPSNIVSTTSVINEGGVFSSSDVTLTVTNVGQITDEEIIQIESEWMHVTGIATNDLTVTRGVFGTTAVSHADGTAISRVKQSGFQTRVDHIDQVNGDLYISPSPTLAAVSGLRYEIFAHSVDPDDVDRARDKALTKLCSQWALQPLSFIPNGDFEDAIASSNWVLSNSTIAIQSLSFPTEFARNSLLVTNTGANGRASSASIFVQPGWDFYFYLPVSVRSGTAQVIIRDITNGANINPSTDTSTLRGWNGIEVKGSVPDTCQEIQVWLVGQEASAVVEWGPINAHWQDARTVRLPARVESRKHVGGWFVFNNKIGMGGSNEDEESLNEVFTLRTRQVRDSVQLHLERSLVDQPYFFEERIFYTALQTDYQSAYTRNLGDVATTLCPIEYATAATVRLIAEQYIHKEGQDEEFWSSLHGRAMTDLARFEDEYGPKKRPKQERLRGIVIPVVRI